MTDNEVIEQEIEAAMQQKSEHTGGEEIPEMPKQEEPPVDEMDEAFRKFRQSKSDHVVEESETYQKEETSFIPSNPNAFDNFKLRIFMGLFFTLIDGIHLIIYKAISPYDLDKKHMALDETDQEGLQMYFQTERVMNLINKIPVEFMGLLHMEWLYWNRYKETVQLKEEQEAERHKKIAILTQIKKKLKKKPEPEEKEEPEPEKKKPVKKAVRKKAKRKKKAAPKKEQPGE